MSRPRIRSIKPEMWADEKIGHLSRDGRLLFVGLITMADDEGRFRALPALILGHCCPYDPDGPRRLKVWLKELADAALVVLYEADDTPYGLIPHFRDHQKINRPSDSLLPAPSVNGHVPVTDHSVSET